MFNVQSIEDYLQPGVYLHFLCQAVRSIIPPGLPIIWDTNTEYIITSPCVCEQMSQKGSFCIEA